MSKGEETRDAPSEETIDWKTFVSYALISLVMLYLTAFALVERQSAAFQQARIEFSQENAEKGFIKEFALLLQRRALRDAQLDVATLRHQIQDLPVQDKAALYGRVDDIAAELDAFNKQIDAASEQLIRYLNTLRTRASPARSTDLSLGFIGVAHAQGQNVITPEIKLGFAVVALLIIVLVMGYCLWIIGRPIASNANKQIVTALNADKKWAKELLNKELVFLGGLVIGIVIK
jgi:hypothetical protein